MVLSVVVVVGEAVILVSFLDLRNFPETLVDEGVDLELRQLKSRYGHQMGLGGYFEEEFRLEV